MRNLVLLLNRQPELSHHQFRKRVAVFDQHNLEGQFFLHGVGIPLGTGR